MSNKSNKINLEKKILEKIKSEEIKMKPKWYFTLISSVMALSLSGLIFGSAFLVNLLIFLARRNGNRVIPPRVEILLASFPWWIPLLALLGLVFSILLIKKYDFSYKYNFKIIVLLFVTSILLAAFLIDKFGVNESLAKGRMKGFYRNIDKNTQLNYLDSTEVKGINSYQNNRHTKRWNNYSKQSYK